MNFKHNIESSKRRKSVSFWNSAPDPTGGAYDAPPDPLIDWKTPPCATHPTPGRRSVSQLGAFGTLIVNFPKNLGLPYQLVCMTSLAAEWKIWFWN